MVGLTDCVVEFADTVIEVVAERQVRERINEGNTVAFLKLDKMDRQVLEV